MTSLKKRNAVRVSRVLFFLLILSGCVNSQNGPDSTAKLSSSQNNLGNNIFLPSENVPSNTQQQTLEVGSSCQVNGCPSSIVLDKANNTKVCAPILCTQSISSFVSPICGNKPVVLPTNLNQACTALANNESLPTGFLNLSQFGLLANQGINLPLKQALQSLSSVASNVSKYILIPAGTYKLTGLISNDLAQEIGEPIQIKDIDNLTVFGCGEVKIISDSTFTSNPAAVGTKYEQGLYPTNFHFENVNNINFYNLSFSGPATTAVVNNKVANKAVPLTNDLSNSLFYLKSKINGFKIEALKFNGFITSAIAVGDDPLINVLNISVLNTKFEKFVASPIVLRSVQNVELKENEFIDIGYVPYKAKSKLISPLSSIIYQLNPAALVSPISDNLKIYKNKFNEVNGALNLLTNNKFSNIKIEENCVNQIKSSSGYLFNLQSHGLIVKNNFLKSETSHLSRVVSPANKLSPHILIPNKIEQNIFYTQKGSIFNLGYGSYALDITNNIFYGAAQLKSKSLPYVANFSGLQTRFRGNLFYGPKTFIPLNTSLVSAWNFNVHSILGGAFSSNQTYARDISGPLKPYFTMNVGVNTVVDATNFTCNIIPAKVSADDWKAKCEESTVLVKNVYANE